MAGDVPGFWSGLLHAFLIAFSFIGSLFTDVRISAFPNSAGWYDFGFLLGAAMFLGGCGAGMEN
jgi:predicted phage tail protein